MVDSIGVRVEKYSQIIIFRDERAFTDVVAANPHLQAIFGVEEHEKRAFPGLYIAAVTENYDQRLKAAYDTLKQRSREELIAIRRALNNWEWPAALGNPPVKNWDELPFYRRPDMPEDVITRVDYIKPYADACLVLGVSHLDTFR